MSKPSKMNYTAEQCSLEINVDQTKLFVINDSGIEPLPSQEVNKDPTFSEDFTNFKKPFKKAPKYKPRKSIEIERDLSVSDMEVMTSLTVDEPKPKTLLSSVSNAKTANFLRKWNLQDLQDPCLPFTSIEKCTNYIKQETYRKMRLRNPNSMFLCPTENCFGFLTFNMEILICRECNFERDPSENSSETEEIPILQPTMNFQMLEDFEKDMAKHNDDPTMEELFKKHEMLKSRVPNIKKEGPFWNKLEKSKKRFNELILPRKKQR